MRVHFNTFYAFSWDFHVPALQGLCIPLWQCPSCNTLPWLLHGLVSSLQDSKDLSLISRTLAAHDSKMSISAVQFFDPRAVLDCSCTASMTGSGLCGAEELLQLDGFHIYLTTCIDFNFPCRSVYAHEPESTCSRHVRALAAMSTKPCTKVNISIQAVSPVTVLTGSPQRVVMHVPFGCDFQVKIWRSSGAW